MNTNFKITNELLLSTFAGLTREDDDFVYFDISNGDVLSYQNGYFSSLMDEDQSISNRSLMNKILNNAPKDNVDSRIHILIDQLKLTDFLNEFAIQSQGSEPFLTYAKTFPLELSQKFNGVETKKILFNNVILDEFIQIFENKYVNRIEELSEQFGNYFGKTCDSVANKWIKKNV